MALNFPLNPEIDDTYTSGENTWKYDGVAWNVVATSYDLGSALIPTDISDLTDTDNIIPDNLLDLGITDGDEGQVLTTDGAGSFTFETVEGGGASQNAFSRITVGGTTISASSSTDVFTLAAGTNVTLGLDANNKVITINSSAAGGGGAESFTDLDDSGPLTVDEIAYPAIARLTVSNNGNTSYTFNSHYSGGNPTIYALSGTTIAFKLDVAGHPFEIQNPQGDPYNLGLRHITPDGVETTGSEAQGKTSGTLYWEVPFGISGSYRYQCTIHSNMVGAVSIKAFNAI